MVIMNGRVFCTLRALFQHEHRCSAPRRDFRAVCLYWLNPFSAALLLYPICHLCRIGKHHLPWLCALCVTLAVPKRLQLGSEPYSSFPVSCCLSVFPYLLNMKGSSSWEPDLCQDVVAWGCVVSLGVVHWCLGTCAADVGPSSHGNGKQRAALLIVPGSLLWYGDDRSLQCCKTSLLSFIYRSLYDR